VVRGDLTTKFLKDTKPSSFLFGRNRILDFESNGFPCSGSRRDFRAGARADHGDAFPDALGGAGYEDDSIG